jgi:hypothetical protein
MADNVVTQFRTLGMQLINEALDYAAKGVYDEQTDQNIRDVRGMTQTLLTALQVAQANVARQPTPPFTPPPGE